MYGVADGMGGHAAGEVASCLAVEMLAKLMVVPGATDYPGALGDVFPVAHDAILANGRVDFPSRTGMGTTLTTCMLADDTWAFAHVGDSIAYILSPGVPIAKVTNDHVAFGNALINCLGVTSSSFKGAQEQSFPAHIGDIVVLATDGIYGKRNRSLDPRARMLEVANIIRDTHFQKLAEALVEYALKAGGEDNVTVVAVQVVS